MKHYGYVLALLFISEISQAAPTTIYRGVQRAPMPQVNHHPNPVFRHQAPVQSEQYGYPPPRRVIYPPQVAIITPHVDIYADLPVQQHYERTEEVYLPQGGTYRSTTQYLTPPSNVPARLQRRVIAQGQFGLHSMP